MKKVDPQGKTAKESSESPIPPQPDEPQLPPPIGTARDLVNDRTQLATVKRDGLTQFINESVGQRSQLLRDTLGISIAVLVGGATIYFTNPTTALIKSPWLFLAALSVIVAAILGNLWARTVILRHQQDVSYRIQDDYIKLFDAARNYLLIPTQANLDTLNDSEVSSAPYPNLKTIGEKGHMYVTWLLSLGVLGMVISMTLRISI